VGYIGLVSDSQCRSVASQFYSLTSTTLLQGNSIVSPSDDNPTPFQAAFMALPIYLTAHFIPQGAAVLVFGPTILDIGEQLGVSVGVLSALFFCQATGSAIGSICAGMAVDKLVNYPYTIISLILVASIGSEFSIC
jgi:hypothetical protein